MKYRCGAPASAVALLAAAAFVLALVVAAPTARADDAPPPDFPTRGFFHIAPIYQFGMGDRAAFDSFQYLTLGGGIDHAWFRASVETPMPFILLDGIAGFIGYLGGAEMTIPLYEALNGDQDPGRTRLFQLEAHVRPVRAGPHGLEVGAIGHFDLVQAYVDGERLGSSLFNLGPTVGYVFSNQDVLFRAHVTGGNGFGNHQEGNPYVGFGATLEVPFAPPVAFNAGFDFTGQYMDLRREQRYIGDPPGLAEWGAFGTTMIGLGGIF